MLIISFILALIAFYFSDYQMGCVWLVSTTSMARVTAFLRVCFSLFAATNVLMIDSMEVKLLRRKIDYVARLL